MYLNDLHVADTEIHRDRKLHMQYVSENSNEHVLMDTVRLTVIRHDEYHVPFFVIADDIDSETICVNLLFSNRSKLCVG